MHYKALQDLLEKCCRLEVSNIKKKKQLEVGVILMRIWCAPSAAISVLSRFYSFSPCKLTCKTLITAYVEGTATLIQIGLLSQRRNGFVCLHTHSSTLTRKRTHTRKYTLIPAHASANAHVHTHTPYNDYRVCTGDEVNPIAETKVCNNPTSLLHHFSIAVVWVFVGHCRMFS